MYKLGLVFCIFYSAHLGAITFGNKKELVRGRVNMNHDVVLVDLTHTLNEKIPSWDGGCGFELKTILDYKDCEGVDKFRVQMFGAKAGIGTHLDAPSHCISGGLSVSDLPLESLYAPCVVIDVSSKADATYQISVEDITTFEETCIPILPGSFVIFYTGWSRRWSDAQAYRNDLSYPSLSSQAAEMLVKKDIVGIGIDTLSPDCPANGFPVHQILLGAGKYIVENVANAHMMPPVGAHSMVMPLKIEQGTESPVRLVGFIPA